MQAERTISFEIKEHIGIINKFENGWTKELNVVSWNGQNPKYDIRDWDSGHERMSKGITLHPNDMRRLVDLYLADNSRKVVRRAEAEQRKRAEERESSPRRQYESREQRDEGRLVILGSESETNGAESDAGSGVDPDSEFEPDNGTVSSDGSEPEAGDETSDGAEFDEEPEAGAESDDES